MCVQLEYLHVEKRERSADVYGIVAKGKPLSN
jgi:hypothetical protein